MPAYGGDVVEVTLADVGSLGAAGAALATPSATEDRARLRVSLPAPNGSRTLAEAIGLLDAAMIEAADVTLRRPTRDDVFLALTGRAAEGDGRKEGSE